MRFSSLCLLFTAAISFCFQSQAQYLGKAAEKSLKKHVIYLASDELEGRSPGTNGEKAAADYISKKLASAGLTPCGENGTWYRNFNFSEEITVSETTTLKIHNTVFKLNEDFWPLSVSSDDKINTECIYVKYGITSPEKKYDDYAAFKTSDLKDKIFVIELSSPDGIHPHSEYLKYSDQDTKIQKAKEHGAKGVIFLDTYKSGDDPSTKISKSAKSCGIPVLFAKGMANKLLTDGFGLKADLTVQLVRKEGKGINVIGCVNNNAASNVIIGAHYDHLGWGDEGSLYKGEKAIHNGADDNASGTAAMIEIAKYLAKNGPKNNNYIFIAFSAEEKGLLGSNDYVKSTLFNPEKANYMINMDMVGRLHDNQIAISGTGTSPLWVDALKKAGEGSLQYKSDESGIGPSDHTSFYLQNIPVLHFFTGTHADYHKPSDDFDKVNFPGMAEVSNFILRVIYNLDGAGKLPFTKTKEKDSGKAPKFSVTLGIVPDYLYDGEGMRMDGVTDGKPGAKAGMKAGDILISLGGFKVKDMMTYMEALAKFKKGDIADAEILRGKEKLKLSVQF